MIISKIAYKNKKPSNLLGFLFMINKVYTSAKKVST